MSKTLIAICFLLMTQACFSMSKAEKTQKRCTTLKKYYYHYCNYDYVKAHPNFMIRMCAGFVKAYARSCGGGLVAKKTPASVHCDDLEDGQCRTHRLMYKNICVWKQFGDVSMCPCYKS